jgi:CheY-like chemotaxis protein
LRLLVVEDDEFNAKMVVAFQEGQGFAMSVARSGPEALAALAEDRPDAVLMDIQLPGMSGLETIAAIRQTPDLEKLPILATTALARTEDEERCLAAGADACISKPLDLPRLLELVEEVRGRG